MRMSKKSKELQGMVLVHSEKKTKTAIFMPLSSSSALALWLLMPEGQFELDAPFP